MKRVTGEIAWGVLALGVAAYEFAAEDDQLLSEAVDRFLVSHPHLTRIAVVLLAAHLLNVLPDKVDPIHHTATVMRLQRKHLDRRTIAIINYRRPATQRNQAATCPEGIVSKVITTLESS